jgi:DNA polymerase
MSEGFDLRRVLRQNLQMDELLGLGELPLAPGAIAELERPRSARPAVRPPAAPAVRAAARRASAAVTPSGEKKGPYQPPAGLEGSDRALHLQVIDADEVMGCTSCGLSASRTHTVFGQGNPEARLVFVGEGPGFDEDRTGLAFVGKAGQLLTQMIQAMGTDRDEVFICNIVKCRPPNNRDPAPEEVLACSPYLMRQLEIIQPEVIVALGAPAARTLLRSNDGIGRLRGRFHDFRLGGPLEGGEPIKLMPTYHPAYLLRTPADKAKAWSDLQQVMAVLGLKQPGR